MNGLGHCEGAANIAQTPSLPGIGQPNQQIGYLAAIGLEPMAHNGLLSSRSFGL